MYGHNNSTETSSVTILHFVNNHSGAARYSLEMSSQTTGKEMFNYVYVYTNVKCSDELSVYLDNNNIVIHIPSISFRYFNKKNNYINHIINLISLHIELGNNLVVHDNGVIYIDEELEDYLKAERRFKFIHTLHFFNPNKLFHTYDYIILVTRYAQKYVENSFDIPSRLIYNGVREILPTHCIAEVREYYGFGADDILVLYVGRIEESKGVWFLAKVFSEIGRRDVRLVVVGDGAYNIIFEQIKSNHAQITFTGKLDNQEVHNLMAACNIGVIPSLNEQCSYVALEMMSHGMAIIASEVRGMGELFVGKDIALTVPVDYTDDIPTLDTDVLKQHIITLADDAKLRKRLGERARREWAEHYTAERMARETMEVYRELAAQF